MLKMFLKLALLFMILLNLTSCGPGNLDQISKDVYLVKPDKFNAPDTKIFVGSMIDIKPITFGGDGFSQFRLRYERTPNMDAWLIVSMYSGSKWIFVEKIKIMVNSRIYEFNSMPSPFREVGYPLGGTNVFEQNNFIVSSQFSEAILTADQITVRLIGNNFYFDRDLSKNDIGVLKRFIEYIRLNVSKTATN